MFGSISHQLPGPVKMLTALGWWWHTPHDLIDRIDPSNLNRDTRIVLHTMQHLLTDRILPLDYAEYANALIVELDRLGGALGDRLDLHVLRRSAVQLRENATAVTARAATATDAEARRIDRALMRASRALVPVNYTAGDRFRHDSALPHPAWPSLDGLRELAAQDAGSTELPFYVVHARQTRNRIAHALREANDVLESLLEH